MLPPLQVYDYQEDKGAPSHYSPDTALLLYDLDNFECMWEKSLDTKAVVGWNDDTVSSWLNSCWLVGWRACALINLPAGWLVCGSDQHRLLLWQSEGRLGLACVGLTKRATPVSMPAHSSGLSACVAGGDCFPWHIQYGQRQG